MLANRTLVTTMNAAKGTVANYRKRMVLFNLSDKDYILE